MRNPRLLIFVIVMTVASLAAAGQRTIPMNNGIPVAPTGLAGKPLPAKPVDYATGEGQNIRVSVLAGNLENPWSIAFLPDGSMLVTERAGRLRVIRNGALVTPPVTGGPAAYVAGESGLPGAVHGYMDIALHPKYAENHYIYLTYNKPLTATKQALTLARARFDGKALTEVKDLFMTDQSGTSRIAFGKDGTIFMTTTGTDPQNPNAPQDINSDAGKVLRFKDDGTIPSDNPFVGRTGAKPEVYTIGHRSSLGLVLNPVTGDRKSVV